MSPQVTGLIMAAMFFVTIANAQEHTGTFDPSKVKGPAKGVPNEVLVLGTPHLESLPAQFTPASLRTLHERLVGWKLRIIAIEALSGTQCAFLRQYPRFVRPITALGLDKKTPGSAIQGIVPQSDFENCSLAMKSAKGPGCVKTQSHFHNAGLGPPSDV